MSSIMSLGRRQRVIVMIVLTLGLTLLTASLTGCGRASQADDEYDQAMDQMESIHEYLDDREFYELQSEDFAWLESEFAELSERIDRMDDLSSLPLGLGQVAEFGSARYRSTVQMLDVAKLLSESGLIIANIGNESLTALDDTGIRYEAGNEAETWLDVIQRRDGEIDQALELMEEALAKRRQIDESELPGRVQGNLAKIDDMIDRVESQLDLADQRGVAYETLGADEPKRYLILFQNPAELRPTGGFVGTIAELELHRGQIYSYEFQDVYDISQDYNDSAHVVEPPWGISRFVRDDKLQFQDANWWANFPESAELLMEMAEAADRDEFDGVAAVQPEIIQEMLTITGPIVVEVDGEEREITPENLLDESERQRRLAREGEVTEAGHKEVIELIGEVLLDHLAEGDQEDLVDAAFLMFDSLDRRDMQGFHAEDSVQSFLEERNWAGLMTPEPDTPTIAPIFANITGLKTSLTMQPAMELEILESDSPGLVEGILTLSLEHVGAEEGDPFYEGFQRWWIDVTLPDEVAVIDTNLEERSDPDASNGGVYVVSLDVSEREEISIRFTLQETERLLLRRQPGLLTMTGSVSIPGCEEQTEFPIDEDIVLLLDGQCPEIEYDDEDWIERD